MDALAPTTLTRIALSDNITADALYLADDTAYVAAMRHARGKRCSTACVAHWQALGEARFHDLLVCQGRVEAVGRRSMLVPVTLKAYSPPYTEGRLVATADFVYALNEGGAEGNATVPPLAAPACADAQARLEALRRPAAG